MNELTRVTNPADLLSTFQEFTMQLCGMFIVLGLLAGSGRADELSLAASERGWVWSATTVEYWNPQPVTVYGNNGASPGNNYLAGSGGGDNSIYRNWLEFTIPSFSGQSLVSGTLSLDQPDGGHGGGTETFRLFELAAQPTVPSDVNTSNLFGSVMTSSADNNSTITIALNSAALAFLGEHQGQPIYMGGIDSGENNGGFDFAGSGDLPGIPGHDASVLTLVTSGARTPEPAPIATLGLAIAGLAALRKCGGEGGS